MRPLAVIALLAGALLAGCTSSADDDPQATSGPTFDDLALQATSSTGIIRGVVVDDAIRPIAGAKVALTGGDAREAISTDQGTFGFDKLVPGTYFLAVSKAGFFAAQQSVEVVAGVAEPPIAKVLLAVDAENSPFVDTYVFEGFIECSTTSGVPGVVVLGAALCSFPNIVTDEAGLGNVTQDNFGAFYLLSKKPTWLQSELIWQSTQTLGGKMSVMYSWDCGDANGGFLCDHGAEGTSPVLLTADEAAIAEINGGDYSEEIFVRVFNEGLDETQGAVGLTFQQKFTIYTHAFYGYEPTEGWRLSGGEPVPQPA